MRLGEVRIAMHLGEVSLNGLLYQVTGTVVSLRVTPRNCREKIFGPRIVRLRLLLWFRREFQVLKKVSFEPKLVAVSLSLLNREIRL